MAKSYSDDDLIRAWHGPLSIEEVAESFDIKPKELVSNWMRLKRNGKLPSEQRESHVAPPQPDLLLERLIAVHGKAK